MWNQLSTEQIQKRISLALQHNRDYYNRPIFGAPVSQVNKVLLNLLGGDESTPYGQAWLDNPNHIGTHTFGNSNPYFSGTQELEKEVIEICAKNIFKGKEEYDGYVTPGATESIIMAIWAYRNFFKKEYGARQNEIAIVCSSDTHYAASKAADLLSISLCVVPVDEESRMIDPATLEEHIDEAVMNGSTHFIVISNMMTTFFGTTDDVNLYADIFQKKSLRFKIHVDAAYGGFFYPFSNPNSNVNFQNQHISSITLDPHKFLQAPLGTGLFIARKNIMQYVTNEKSTYIKGLDSTFSGSRSGFQAVSIWAILTAYGQKGWEAHVQERMELAKWFEQELQEKEVSYFRASFSNVFSVSADYFTRETAFEFGLIPDDHANPVWYKIILMPHVCKEKLFQLCHEIKSAEVKAIL